MENDLYVDSISKTDTLFKTDSLIKADYIHKADDIQHLDNTSVVVFMLFFIVSLYLIFKNRK